jgi:hypothetical protein
MDPIFSPGTGEALEKFIKKMVRQSIKRRSDSGNVRIMYGIIEDLAKWRPATTEFGAKYAIEELDVTPSFSDLVVYISESQVLNDSQSTDIISKIMHTMVTLTSNDWLPESLFGVVEELIETKKIKSYQSITCLIIYIMDCDLDVPSPKMVDEMIKSSQCYASHKCETLIRYIVANCNLYEKGGYLDYLKNEKSVGLTQWFQPPAGHQAGSRIEHFELQRAQWTTRLIILSKHTSSVKVWKKFFSTLSTLATNNEKFRTSKTFKICIRQLVINYGHKSRNYSHLYAFIEAIPENVVSHLELDDDIDKYETAIFEPHKYRSVCNALNKFHKKMVYFRLCVLARSIKCHKKYITLRVLQFIYGDEFCHKIRKHDNALMYS